LKFTIEFVLYDDDDDDTLKQRQQ